MVRVGAVLSLLAVAAAEEPFKQVFVTGGSGFVGRNLIRHYVAKGVKVHAIGRSDAALKTVKELGAVGFKADLSDKEGLRKAAKGCDLTVHAAAYVEMWGTMETARAITVEGTRNVIEASAAEGVKRVVHVGTEAGCVTESGAPLVNLDDNVPLPQKPYPGIYSTTKNEAERVALSGKHGIDVVGVRPRLIWGNDDTVVLPAMVEAAEQGVLSWFDGGNYLTSTVHVDNCIEGIEKAALKGRPGEAYFLTDGAPVVFKTFISDMLSAVGVEPPKKEIPMWVVWYVAAVAEGFCSVFGCTPPVTRQALVLVGQQITVVDAKARKELGYLSSMSVEKGIEDLRRRHAKSKKAGSAAEKNEL